MRTLKNGFYTALGTPLDEKGDLLEESLKKHINQQIEAGAAGLLLLGSMGIEAFVKNSAYEKAVKAATEANAGRLPLFVGAMDCSIAKVLEKIALIGDADIDGVVLTAPFYGAVGDAFAKNWFKGIADQSPYPIYLYDLPSAVKYKLTLPVMDELIKHPNIKGMKTADWELIKAIGRKYPDADFECFYSGLNTFDYANMMGIHKNLDGMFACTPRNGKKMADCNLNGDYKGARKYLDNILLLRDNMLKYGLMRCFTHCMNLLGLEGNFHQDYTSPVSDEAKCAMEEILRKIGEI